MKVSSNQETDIEGARTNRKEEVNGSTENAVQAGGKQPPVNSDKINVSNRAATAGKMVEKLQDVPDVRQERVEALRQKIESGEYKPSAESIADAILKDEE